MKAKHKGRSTNLTILTPLGCEGEDRLVSASPSLLSPPISSLFSDVTSSIVGMLNDGIRWNFTAFFGFLVFGLEGSIPVNSTRALPKFSAFAKKSEDSYRKTLMPGSSFA